MILRRRSTTVFYLAGYVILVAVAVRGIAAFFFDGHPLRWHVVGLLAAFAGLMSVGIALIKRLGWYANLYLAIQSGIVLVLMVLRPEVQGADFFAALYILLSGQAVQVLPRRSAIAWIVGFTLLSIAGLGYAYGFPSAVPLILLYVAGYYFVAAYVAATFQAEQAQRETKVLLDELREAHQKLQRYAAQVERLAVVEERNRLARELHDSVTQLLYGLALSTEAAARNYESGDTTLLASELRELRDTAQQALREMRLLIFELRPLVLEHEGLVAALQSRLEAVENRAGVDTAMHVQADGSLPPEVEAGLYRVAQEALNNALKHARARRVVVRLERGEQGVALEVVDDGSGFELQAARDKSGFGLRSMEERVAQLGGRLTVTTGPGAGTRVRAEVPA